ncbi:MAG TPA: DUF3147 family protein [bacterium]|nr:DUF3147 family protein [bacterium]HPS29552.1 DUF3147 family protein [bacterium]
MIYTIVKYLVTAAVVVVVSEVAKRSDRLGSFISSLPLVTLLVLFWLYFENQPAAKLENHAYYTFWYVLPTLPMFIMFPFLHQRFGFWLTIAISIALTVVLFAITGIICKKFGVVLF